MNLFKSKKYLTKGFTLIFAILVSSLLVAIGVAISNVALKQLEISILTRESRIAFSAADSGAECVIYWDVQVSDRGFSFASPDNRDPENTASVSCGHSVSVSNPELHTSSDGGIEYYVTTMVIYYGDTTDAIPDPCAVVSIKKTASIVGKTNIIDSYGINDCSSTFNKHRVERSLRVEYQ